MNENKTEKVINTIIFPHLTFEQDPFLDRAIAFKHVAMNHPMQDYLMLCHYIAIAQSQTVRNCINDITIDLKEKSLPLLKDHPNECLYLLKVLLNQLLKNKELNAAAKDVINILVRHVLNQKDRDFLAQEAECLMSLDLEKITLEFSPFIGAALQVFYTMKAYKIGKSQAIPANFAIEKDSCPCCGMPPIASVIDLKYKGLRYLHCSVCETKWFLDQDECYECDQNKYIERVSLPHSLFKIKAENCHNCMTYLKWLDLSNNPLLDVFVEDLISRDLDAALLAENYICRSQNFYMLTKTV